MAITNTANWLQAVPARSAEFSPSPAAVPLATGQSPDFASVLGEAVGKVNAMQVDADAQAQSVATGQCDNIHEAVLAMDKASLSLQLTVAVMNRAVAAYKEISQLQM
jgi:flagellar hook-basal body complex protein FliE